MIIIIIMRLESTKRGLGRKRMQNK